MRALGTSFTTYADDLDQQTGPTLAGLEMPSQAFPLLALSAVDDYERSLSAVTAVTTALRRRSTRSARRCIGSPVITSSWRPIRPRASGPRTTERSTRCPAGTRDHEWTDPNSDAFDTLMMRGLVVAATSALIVALEPSGRGWPQPR